MEIKSLMKVTALSFAGLFSLSVNAATTGLDFAGGCPEDRNGVTSLCAGGSNATEANVAAILGVDISLVTQEFTGFTVTNDDGSAPDGTSTFGDWTVDALSGITHIAFKSDGYFILGEVNALSGTWDNADWDLTLAICPVTICTAGPREYTSLDFTNNGGNIAELSNARAFSVVPVPAALWLFGSGLLGLAGIARRKKS